eukprot:scaffold126537_cov30-Tisochrysis_lutea.AAC.3
MEGVADGPAEREPYSPSPAIGSRSMGQSERPKTDKPKSRWEDMRANLVECESGRRFPCGGQGRSCPTHVQHEVLYAHLMNQYVLRLDIPVHNS